MKKTQKKKDTKKNELADIRPELHVLEHPWYDTVPFIYYPDRLPEYFCPLRNEWAAWHLEPFKNLEFVSEL